MALLFGGVTVLTALPDASLARVVAALRQAGPARVFLVLAATLLAVGLARFRRARLILD